MKKFSKSDQCSPSGQTCSLDVFVDKMTELVAATVPNVDPGKGSEREGRSGEWPRAGKTKQRAEQTRRGRRADGGEGENG